MFAAWPNKVLAAAPAEGLLALRLERLFKVAELEACRSCAAFDECNDIFRSDMDPTFVSGSDWRSAVPPSAPDSICCWSCAKSHELAAAPGCCGAAMAAKESATPGRLPNAREAWVSEF